MAKPDWYCDDVLSGALDVQRVFEDERVLAFHHPRPAAQVHVVIVPKEHVSSLLDPKALDGQLLTSMLAAVQHTARTFGLDVGGEGFYVRANAASPSVTPHMHWHVLGPGAGANSPEPLPIGNQ